MATKKVSRGTSAKKKSSKKSSVKKTTKGKTKVHKVMHEYKEGKLHTRSKKGPVVKSRKQAIAIALSEAGMSRGSSKKKRSKR